MRALTIGEVARQAGVGIETVRFYERRGLIQRPLKPRDSGFRIYPAEQIKRSKFTSPAVWLFVARDRGTLVAAGRS